MNSRHAILLSVLLALASATASAETVRVFADRDTPQVAPVLAELRASDDDATFVLEGLALLGEPRDESTIVLSVHDDDGVRQSMEASGCTPSPDLKPEGFSLRRAFGA